MLDKPMTLEEARNTVAAVEGLLQMAVREKVDAQMAHVVVPGDLARLLALLDAQAAEVERLREAGGLYSPEGDCIQFFHSDVPYKRDRVDDLLTLYRALDDQRVIGFQLKGISRLEAAARRAGTRLSEWAREALLRAAGATNDKLDP